MYRGGCALTSYLGPGRTRATITRNRQIGKPPRVLLVLEVMDIGYREINTPDFTTSPKSRWERLPEWLHYPMAIQGCHPAAPLSGSAPTYTYQWQHRYSPYPPHFSATLDCPCPCPCPWAVYTHVPLYPVYPYRAVGISMLSP